jgi:hypothetical protein
VSCGIKSPKADSLWLRSTLKVSALRFRTRSLFFQVLNLGVNLKVGFLWLLLKARYWDDHRNLTAPCVILNLLEAGKCSIFRGGHFVTWAKTRSKKMFWIICTYFLFGCSYGPLEEMLACIWLTNFLGGICLTGILICFNLLTGAISCVPGAGCWRGIEPP